MKKDSFVKGATIATICMFISKFLGIIYVIPFYSIIGEQGGALYGYAYSIYSIFLSISTAGIPVAISKIISEYDALGQAEAKQNVYKVAIKILGIISLTAFLILILFAPQIAKLIIGEATGGNTIQDISLAIRCISFAILVVPYLSVLRGFLQGEKFITPTSISEIIEQIIRIAILLLGSYVIIETLNKSITLGVCVSVLGASIGGLGAYLYLKIIANKHKIIKNKVKEDKKLNKEIIKKIIKYAIPLIIVSTILSIYNFTDLVLTLRTMTDILKIDTNTAEKIISLYTTWGEKFQRIVAVASVGVGISLIPNLVRAYVKKENLSVQTILNKAISIVIYIGLPITILISLFSNEVWAIFYGASVEGPIIIRYSIYVGLLSSLSTIATTSLQSMNKYKKLYLSIILGVLLNAILDIPLILLFTKLGFNPCYGSITASIIGFGFTTIYALSAIKKDCNIKYNSLLEFMRKLILPVLGLIIMSLLLKYIINIDVYNNRWITMLITCIYFGLPLLTYAFISYKNRLVLSLFSEEKINRLLRRKNG